MIDIADILFLMDHVEGDYCKEKASDIKAKLNAYIEEFDIAMKGSIKEREIKS